MGQSSDDTAKLADPENPLFVARILADRLNLPQTLVAGDRSNGPTCSDAHET